MGSKEQTKKERLKYQMVSFVNCVLDAADNEHKLDYINIEINNHNGNLQMDYTLRNRKVAIGKLSLGLFGDTSVFEPFNSHIS